MGLAAFLSHLASFLLCDISHLLDEVEPKPSGEVVRTNARQLLLGIGSDDATDIFLNERTVGLADPVDRYLQLVVVLMQMACGMGRQLEHGRTAHASMGDEEWTLRLELGAGDGGHGGEESCRSTSDDGDMGCMGCHVYLFG